MSGDDPPTAMSQASISGPGNLQIFDSDSDIRVPTLDHNDLDNKNDSDIDSNIDIDTESMEVRHNKPNDSINHVEFVIYMSSSRSRGRRFRLVLNDIAKGLLAAMWYESIEKCQAYLLRIAAITLKPAAILSTQPQPRTLCRFHNVAIMIATY